MQVIVPMLRVLVKLHALTIIHRHAHALHNILLHATSADTSPASMMTVSRTCTFHDFEPGTHMLSCCK